MTASNPRSTHDGDLPPGNLPTGLNVSQFLEWADANEGLFELWRGQVHAMAPGCTGHGLTIGAAYIALFSATKVAGLDCQVVPDTLGVQIDDASLFIPDVVVNCGPQDRNANMASNPIIVVEVLSPSTTRVDTIEKLRGYFKVPSIRHYLIIDPDGAPILHYERKSDGRIEVILRSTGPFRLDPPGIDLKVEDLIG